MRLEDAVDELRRLVLSRPPGRRAVPKADIVRSYEWLGVTDAALRDVDRMYRRAYGGVGHTGAIDGLRAVRRVEPLPFFQPPRSFWEDDDDEEEDDETIEDEVQVGIEEEAVRAVRESAPETEQESLPRPLPRPTPRPIPRAAEQESIPLSLSLPEAQDAERNEPDEATTGLIRISLMIPPLSLSTPKGSPRPSPTLKGPPLKLQTNFLAKPVAAAATPKEKGAVSPGGNASDEEEEQLTARPIARAPQLPVWSPGASIAEVMMSAHPDRLPSGFGFGIATPGGGNAGPTTPNDYEDISPITRGEWGFLMVQPDGWGGAKRVAVETC